VSERVRDESERVRDEERKKKEKKESKRESERKRKCVRWGRAAALGLQARRPVRVGLTAY
jgi:hypothetical protein